MSKEVSKEFVQGFVEKCAEYGVDPEALVKSAIGGAIRTGLRQMGQTPIQTAQEEQKYMQDWGNRGLGSRIGQRLWNPLQASRATQQWKRMNAPQPTAAGRIVPQQPIPASADTRFRW